MSPGCHGGGWGGAEIATTRLQAPFEFWCRVSPSSIRSDQGAYTVVDSTNWVRPTRDSTFADGVHGRELLFGAQVPGTVLVAVAVVASSSSIWAVDLRWEAALFRCETTHAAATNMHAPMPPATVTTWRVRRLEGTSQYVSPQNMSVARLVVCKVTQVKASCVCACWRINPGAETCDPGWGATVQLTKDFE